MSALQHSAFDTEGPSGNLSYWHEHSLEQHRAAAAGWRHVKKKKKSRQDGARQDASELSEPAASTD